MIYRLNVGLKIISWTQNFNDPTNGTFSVRVQLVTFTTNILFKKVGLKSFLELVCQSIYFFQS